MRKLLMLQGLPGSGKSHWALEQKQLDPANVLIVSKDDIRLELSATGWQWSHENEKHVLALRDSRIIDAFGTGFTTVISSDTNFGRKHKVRLNELAVKAGAQFEVKRFDTSVAVCIERDATRQGSARVGEEVIRKMAAQYGLLPSPLEPSTAFLHLVTPNTSLMPAVICDLDGTLALNKGHRSFYDASTCDQDGINRPVLEVIRALYVRFVQVIYLSGREDKYRQPTEVFLDKYQCPPGPLHMRTTSDMRKDWIVKSELFDANVRSKYNVLFCLDDRDQVVKMWRDLGLACFQVNYGNF